MFHAVLPLGPRGSGQVGRTFGGPAFFEILMIAPLLRFRLVLKCIFFMWSGRAPPDRPIRKVPAAVKLFNINNLGPGNISFA